MKLRVVPSWKIAGILLATILLVFSSCEVIEEVLNPYNAELLFEQIDLNLDGEMTNNSSCGSVVLTYDGSSEVLYFNLAVNDEWTIQNIPIVSIEGAGVRQSITFWFDLGVEDGTEVTELHYAYDVTTTVRDTIPTVTYTAEVVDRSVIFYPGLLVDLVYIDLPNIIFGGKVTDYALVSDWNKTKYNQDCGNNECVPTAVSNSLKWLKDKHGLTYPEDPTIERMKEATGWGPGGCSSGWPTDNPENKDQYMSDNGYPITTTTTTDVAEALNQVKLGQDVELDGHGHVAMIVGIAKLDNGNYSILVAHDTKQGTAGGTRIESTIYNPNTKTFTPSHNFQGPNFDGFVIECPE